MHFVPFLFTFSGSRGGRKTMTPKRQPETNRERARKDWNSEVNTAEDARIAGDFARVIGTASTNRTGICRRRLLIANAIWNMAPNRGKAEELLQYLTEAMAGQLDDLYAEEQRLQ